MRVAVRVDASPLIGGGHAMRCLTLADALTEKGADVTFLAAAMMDRLGDRIEASGHKLVRIPSSPELEREGENWHAPPLSDEAQTKDVRATESTLGTVDWVVVDHYLLDARWHSAARRFAEHVLVIDDLANRPYDCDLLLDQTFGRSAGDYKGLVPDDTTVLAGAHYALLRTEFVRERPAALMRRRELKPVERILVSLGTTDPGAITAMAVDAVLAAAPECAVDVVLAQEAESLAHVQEMARQRPNVSVHVNSDRMAELMRDADLAVGAAGTTSWERCCLGLPSVALVLAENQRPTADALEQGGAAIKMERADGIGATIADLVDDATRLQRMCAAAFAITDGAGASRVLHAMSNPAPRTASARVELRQATADDAELLWLWRNDPDTRVHSRTTEPIGWTDHVRWLTAVLADPDRHLMIADRAGTPVGTVRFEAIPGDSAAFEVSIAISPATRGEGLGRAMLQAACDQFAAKRGACRVYASVREGNERSRRLFESAGFRSETGAERGWLRYVQGRSVGVQRKLA